MEPAEELITPSQAAALLGVSIDTIRRWADVGLLPSQRTLGGHRRFKRADVVKALATQTQPAA